MSDNKVQDQYLEFPYPPRDPNNEKRRLLKSAVGYLNLINNIFWGGKKALDKNFRVLDAGCGTGDSVIHIAEQLKNTDAEIIALDFSNSSLEIAKKRAEIRDLKNIKFIEGSILEISGLNLGKFDYIVCTGVLHHLESPEEGLKKLQEILKEDGGMGIMLYGKYGRIGIYIMQELLRIINKSEEDKIKKIENAKEIIKDLINPIWKISEKNFFQELQSTTGMYDLLLHSRDKPYTVQEVYSLVESAKLKIVKFEDNFIYNPYIYLKDKDKIKKIIDNLSKREQEIVAELLNGGMKKHIFFVSNNNYFPPKIEADNLNNIPVYKEPNPKLKEMKENGMINIQKGDYKVVIRANKINTEILKLIDGKKSIKEILNSVSKETNSDYKVTLAEWNKIYDLTKQTDLIILNPQ